MNYLIRDFKDSDLKDLIIFFIKAYGPETIFQDARFLKWFFGDSICLVALNEKKEIIAHYGGLKRDAIMCGRQVFLLWGVNAYTLPEYRGLGINRSLVETIKDRCDVFGVINFTPKTASFYSAMGFNMFENRRFARLVLNLDKATYEIAKAIGRNCVDKLDVFDIEKRLSHDKSGINEINKENMDRLSVDYDYLSISAAVKRSTGYLKRRFLSAPYADYRCIAWVCKDRILSYAVIKRERLYPTAYYITRIVDLFGKEDYIWNVVCEAVLIAKDRGDIFVDFYLFGKRYKDILAYTGFSILENEDVGLLPQVTAPIEDRPNTAYAGLFSSKYKEEISGLREEDVFFTRSDSDMDRLNNIGQISDER